MLDQEIKYFNEHLSEWLKIQSGKIVVIKDKEVVGFYNTFDEALYEGARRFGLNSFLVRYIIAEQDEIRIPAMTIGVLHANLTHSITR